MAPEWPSHVLIAGEPGAGIIPGAGALDGEIVVDTPGKGMFYATGLHETLQARGNTHLVFTGVTTGACAQTSMREANDRGCECLLVDYSDRLEPPPGAGSTR